MLKRVGILLAFSHSVFAQPGVAAMAKIMAKAAGKSEQRIVVMFPRSGAAAVEYELPVRSGLGSENPDPSRRVDVGDPLAPVAAPVIVRSGQEERAVNSWIRPLSIAGRTCVLAEQEYGFETVKRNHSVVCMTNGKPEKLWFREDGEGPWWSTVDIRGAGFIYYEGFATPDGPETLTATVITYTGGRFAESAAKVHTVLAGSFSDENAARQARNKASAQDAACARFWILRNEGKPGILLAAKTMKTEKELLNWNRFRSCYPALKMVD